MGVYRYQEKGRRTCLAKGIDMIKKIVTGLGIAGLLCLIPLSVNYICNMRFISNYDKGIYKSSEVNQVLGFTQPYVYHYNNGNVYYNEGDYQGAEEEYRTALGYKPRGERDCMTRINLALAIVKQIDPESVTAENLDETIELLDDARNILVENGCAHRDDEDGHNKDAQTLKDEIDVFEEQLKQSVQDQKSSGGSDDKDQQYGQDDQDTPDDSDGEQGSSSASEEEKIKEKLQEIQGDSLKQRNSEMDTYETYKDGYNYYDGRTW